jgi:hypothetical protein
LAVSDETASSRADRFETIEIDDHGVAVAEADGQALPAWRCTIAATDAIHHHDP